MKKKEAKNLNPVIIERQKIRKLLQFGDLAHLCRTTGLSKSTIDRWFKGQGNNDSIPYALNKLISSRNATQRSLNIITEMNQ